jgi:hypothetical protein
MCLSGGGTTCRSVRPAVSASSAFRARSDQTPAERAFGGPRFRPCVLLQCATSLVGRCDRCRAQCRGGATGGHQGGGLQIADAAVRSGPEWIDHRRTKTAWAGFALILARQPLRYRCDTASNDARRTGSMEDGRVTDWRNAEHALVFAAELGGTRISRRKRGVRHVRRS